MEEVLVEQKRDRVLFSTLSQPRSWVCGSQSWYDVPVPP